MSAPPWETVTGIRALVVPVQGPVRQVVLPLDAMGEVEDDALVRAVGGESPWVSGIAEHDIDTAAGRVRVLVYAEHDPGTAPNPRMSRLLATADDAPVRGGVVLVAVRGSDPQDVTSLPREALDQLHAHLASASERPVSALLSIARSQPSAALAVTEVDEFGMHPMSLPAGRVVALHTDAPPGGNREAPGPRCGGCAHRGNHTPVGARSRPKCGLFAQAGAASTTSVAAWWPACSRFEPRAGEQR